MQLLNDFLIGRRCRSLNYPEHADLGILTTPDLRKHKIRTFPSRRILRNNIPQLQNPQIKDRRLPIFEMSISKTKINIPKQITNKFPFSLRKNLRTEKTMATLNQDPSLKRLSLVGTDFTLSKEIASSLDYLPSHQKVETCTYGSRNQFTPQQTQPNRYRYFIIKKSHENRFNLKIKNVKFTSRKSKLLRLIGKGYPRNCVDLKIENASKQLKPWSQNVQHFQEY